MAGYITKPAAAINKALVEFLPELDSEYATYPMNYPRWYEPCEQGPKGEPCFIASNLSSVNAIKKVAIKKDYAYCSRGPNGPGYYSLLCHYAYVVLYQKVKTLAPQSAACPCFNSKEVRDALDRHDDCQRVMYMRQLSTDKPDDRLAENIVMGRAKATADKVYNFTQNEALVVNTINAAAAV